MTPMTRTTAAGFAALALLTTGACSDAGDLEIINDGSEDVVVRLSDRGVDPVEVTAGGGVAVLDYGCTPGDVTVEFPSAAPVVLPGPVCPDQEIRIGDGTARLASVAAGDDGEADGA